MTPKNTSKIQSSEVTRCDDTIKVIINFFYPGRWEQYVYLAGRTPIMVNSNYYGLDLLYHVPTSRQVSRAASIVHSIFKYRSLLDREKIKPVGSLQHTISNIIQLFLKLKIKIFCDDYFLMYFPSVMK